MRTSIRVPATVDPLPGGEAIVAAPAAGRFTAGTSCRRSATASARARSSDGSSRGWRLAPTARRSRLKLPRRRPRSKPRAPKRRAPNGCWPIAPSRRGAWRTRSGRSAVAEARLRAAEARLAQRDETLRTGGGAAAGNAFALRAPIAGRLAEVMATLGASYDEGAPLFRIVRTDAVELEVQVPAADVLARTKRGRSRRWSCPASPTPVPLQAPSRARCRRHRPDDPSACRCRWRSRIPASSC